MGGRPGVVGLDLGTSSLKVVLVGADHDVIAQATADYNLISDAPPGHAEIDPEIWRQALETGIRQVLAEAADISIVGVGIDGQMHGLVAVDRGGDAVRPAMLWPDTRANDIVASWKSLPRERLQALANPLAPGMTGPMLAWLIEHEASTMARVAHVVQPKDWLRGQLTGWVPVTDPSDASATLLWDMSKADWDHELCAMVGIDASLLVDVRPSDDVAGHVTPAAADATGLPPGIPVSVGCADVAATMLGMGFTGDRRTVIVGTGAQSLGPVPSADASWPIRHHTYLSAAGSTFAMAAVMNAGLALGRVLEWFGASWEELYDAQERSLSGERTGAVPVFLPYLAGERPPLSVNAGRGGFHRLGLESGRTDLLVAALEGVVFAIDQALSELPDVGDGMVDITGGGAMEPAFQQLLADVLQSPVQGMARPDATALGAAALGWSAASGGPPAASVPRYGDPVSPRERPELQVRRETFRRLTARLE